MVRKIIPLLAALVLVLLQASPAGAHAEVVGSSPGDGETVGGDFDRIDIVFAERVTEATIEVMGPDGSVPGAMVQGEGLVIAFGLDSKLRDGDYAVTFKFDSLDEDFVTLDFTFTYSADAPPPIAVVATVDNDGLSAASLAAIALLAVCTLGLAGLLAWRYRQLARSQT